MLVGTSVAVIIVVIIYYKYVQPSPVNIIQTVPVQISEHTQKDSSNDLPAPFNSTNVTILTGGGIDNSASVAVASPVLVNPSLQNDKKTFRIILQSATERINLTGKGIAPTLTTVKETFGVMPTTISGVVYKGGTVSGAFVTVYPVNKNGTYGASVGSGLVDLAGMFSIPISATSVSPLAIIIRGGSYVSSIDRIKVTETSDMCAMIADPPSFVGKVTVTPFSDFVCLRASNLAFRRYPIVASIAYADNVIKYVYGFHTIPEKITPSFTLASLSPVLSDGGLLAILLSAMDKLRLDYVTKYALISAIHSDDMYKGLSEDFSDGFFDGMKNGSSIISSNYFGTAGKFPFTAGTVDFVTSLQEIPSSLFK